MTSRKSLKHKDLSSGLIFVHSATIAVAWYYLLDFVLRNRFGLIRVEFLKGMIS